MENKYLPVGTVVALKDGAKNIMITGFCVLSNEENKYYDYSACFYPEGIVSSDINLLFNHSQIEKVLYMGFVDDSEIKFKQRLNEIVSEKTKNGEITFSDSESSVNTQNFAVNQQQVVQNQTSLRPQMYSNNYPQ